MKNITQLSIIIIILFIQVLRADQGTLKIGIYHSPPFITIHDNNTYSGISIWLWERVAKEQQRKYKFIIYPLEKSPLKQIIQDVSTGKLDLTINPLTVTSHRNKIMNFSHPYYVGNLTIAHRKQAALDAIKLITTFFNKHILAVVFYLFVLISIFGVLIWITERKTNKEQFDSSIKGIVTGIWWSAVTMATVGYGDKTPKSPAGRSIAIIWMFLSLVIIAAFTATVTSSLTISRLHHHKTLDDFKQLTVGTVTSSASVSYLKRKFFRHIVTYPELRIGLKALQRGEIEAFIYDEPWLVYIINNEKSYNNLELLPLRFNTQLYSMPSSPQLPNSLKESISSSIVKITETTDWELLLNEYNLHRY